MLIPIIQLTEQQYRQLEANTKLFAAGQLIPFEDLIQLNLASPDDEHDALVELMYLKDGHTAVCSWRQLYSIEIEN